MPMNPMWACQRAGASTVWRPVVAGSASAALTLGPIRGVVAPRPTTPTMSSGLGVSAKSAVQSVGATATIIKSNDYDYGPWGDRLQPC